MIRRFRNHYFCLLEIRICVAMFVCEFLSKLTVFNRYLTCLSWLNTPWLLLVLVRGGFGNIMRRNIHFVEYMIAMCSNVYIHHVHHHPTLDLPTAMSEVVYLLKSCACLYDLSQCLNVSVLNVINITHIRCS